MTAALDGYHQSQTPYIQILCILFFLNIIIEKSNNLFIRDSSVHRPQDDTKF